MANLLLLRAEGRRQELVGDIGKTLWVIMATIGMVLLIACANGSGSSDEEKWARRRLTRIRQQPALNIRSYQRLVGALATDRPSLQRLGR